MGFRVGREGVHVDTNCGPRATGSTHSVDDSRVITEHYANALQKGSSQPHSP